MYIALIIAILVLYCPAALWLFLYGMNNYYMIVLYFKNVKKETAQNKEFLERFWATYKMDDLPKVTTQLPIYNEKNVAERLIDAVVKIDYPKELHEIQVLDDSNDETRDIVTAAVEKYIGLGYDIQLITRHNREGYKAGALNKGLQCAKGEFIAIFDADFVPEKDFLYNTIPFFYERDKVALVQTRWGHLNRDYSLLTVAQSIGMDGHFIIEQSARTWNGFYMNFNGTAGVWRKEAIADADGWHYDTLTEDLDLSYRAQLNGWKTKYLHDVVTPAELPVDINAYKSQQHRWAKGSIQTSKKILPRVFRANDGLLKKIEAFMHLNQYMVHPMMIILAVLSLPLILLVKHEVDVQPMPLSMAAILAPIFLGAFAPSFLYVVSQKALYKDWKSRCLYIPALMFIGCGVAVNNTKAVMEALLNIKSGFVRTPKYGIVNRGKKAFVKNYALPPRLLFVGELALSLYCFAGFMQYACCNEFIFGPFLLMYAIGFFYVGSVTIIQRLKARKSCCEPL